MAIIRKTISFKTIDGLTLRGWLYPVDGLGPAIILTPGLPCVKEMFVPQAAEVFQQAGVNCLVYDPRNLGESDGLPRSEIDPMKQVSDYSDALSFLLTQPCVDARQVAFWGMSFSATIALCAASLDKRAQLCIAACPYVDVTPPRERIPQILGKVMADRQSQLAGNQPTYLPMLTKDGKNPAGLSLHPTKEELELILTAQSRGAVNFENKCTLETYYKFLVWQPQEIMKLLAPTPVLVIVPELDTWSAPEKQLALFESFVSSKKLHIVAGKGHLTLFNGSHFSDLMQKQVDFLKDGYEGRLA